MTTILWQNDGVGFTGAGPGVIGPFYVLGGRYAFAVAASAWGAAQLQTLMLDGTTYEPVAAAITANGNETMDLPAGTVEIVITGGATGVTGSLARVPYRGS